MIYLFRYHSRLLGQSKDYKIGIFCFSARHAAYRRKGKNWLARNQDNVSEWSDISIRGLLLQWASTKKSNYACWYSTNWTSSSYHWTLICSRHDIAEKLLSWHYTTITHSLTLEYDWLVFNTKFSSISAISWYVDLTMSSTVHFLQETIQFPIDSSSVAQVNRLSNPFLI